MDGNNTQPTQPAVQKPPVATTTNPELEAYKQYVKDKLAKLSPLFAKASIGDFSDDVEIPLEEDEFSEFYTGIQVIIEVIRQKISELENVNSQMAERAEESDRLNKVLIGRELKMIELKQKITELEAKLSGSQL